MNIVNQVTDVVKQGGVRRGANMGMMRVTHPDVLRFIHAKNDQHSLTNFNISVNVTDKFLKAVDNNEWFQLEFDGEPWTDSIYDPVRDDDYVVYRRPDGSTVTFRDQAGVSDCRSFQLHDRRSRRVRAWSYAPDIWNRIVASAHKYAEPGIAFIDEVNRHNHMMKSMGPIYSCNPCGEQFLHFSNSCNLGSIDLAKFYDPRETSRLGSPARSDASLHAFSRQRDRHLRLAAAGDQRCGHIARVRWAWASWALPIFV